MLSPNWCCVSVARTMLLMLEMGKRDRSVKVERVSLILGILGD